MGYLLRQTLGRLDAQGQPLQEQVLVPYSQMIRHAGVSRGALREVLEEAQAQGFVRCVREGRPKRSGQSAVSALYELCWDESAHYAETLDEFQGFYAGEGRRTPVPNGFFDSVLPAEAHSAIKVVGAVLRHTVGFQNRYGGRRQQAALSYDLLQSHTRVSRAALTAALAHSLNTGYIYRIEEGRFEPGHGNSTAAVYAVRWRERRDNLIGSKVEPENRSKS